MKSISGLTVALVSMLLAMGAQAAWVVEPAIEISSGYDDNVRLDVDENDQNQEEDAIVSEVAAQARLRRVTEVSEFSALVGASYLDYSSTDADDLDDEDSQFVALRASRTLQRGGFGLDGNFKRDLTLRRLAPIPDLIEGVGIEGQDAEAGTGAAADPNVDEAVAADEIDVNATREQFRRTHVRVRPYVDFQLSEVSTIGLDYAYTDRSYDSDGRDAGLRDTNTHAVTAQYSRDVSPRTSWRLTVGAARFEADGYQGSPDREADNYSALVGLDTLLTPQTRLSLDVGAGRSENDDTDENETSLRYSARITRIMPISRLILSAGRAETPSAFGGLVKADRLSVRYQRSLSERLEFSAGAYGYRTRRLGDAGTPQDDRDYFDVEPRLTWRVTNSWNAGLSYRYRWTDRDFGTGDVSADSSFVSVFLNYQPQPRI